LEQDLLFSHCDSQLLALIAKKMHPLREARCGHGSESDSYELGCFAIDTALCHDLPGLPTRMQTAHHACAKRLTSVLLTVEARIAGYCCFARI
jgi:hypothetical protein